MGILAGRLKLIQSNFSDLGCLHNAFYTLQYSQFLDVEYGVGRTLVRYYSLESCGLKSALRPYSYPKIKVLNITKTAIFRQPSSDPSHVLPPSGARVRAQIP